MKMNFIQSLFFIFVIFSFFVGLLFYSYPNTPYLKFLENMDSIESELNSNTFSSNDVDQSFDMENNDAQLNMNLENANEENVDNSIALDAQIDIHKQNIKQMNMDNVNQEDEGENEGEDENDGENENEGEDEDVNEPENEGEDETNIKTNEMALSVSNNEIKSMNILPTPSLVSRSVLYTSTPLPNATYPSLKNGTNAPGKIKQQNKIFNANSNVNANRNVSGAVISSTMGEPALGPAAPKPGETLQKLQPVQNINALNRQNPYASSTQSPSQNDGGIYDSGYPSFKESDYTIGKYSYLDALRDSMRGSQYSDNPMDSNWGGVEWSRNAVESGKYNDRLVVPYAISNGFSTSSRFNKQPLNVFA